MVLDDQQTPSNAHAIDDQVVRIGLMMEDIRQAIRERRLAELQAVRLARWGPSL